MAVFMRINGILCLVSTVKGKKMDNGDHIPVPVAKGQDGPVWEPSADGTAKSDLVCYECSSRLFYRSAHVRTRCGITFPVKGHFCHQPHSKCSGESYVHAAAKHAVQAHAHKMTFVHTCNECQRQCSVEVCPPLATAACEVSFDDYRADVGFLSSDGSLQGIVEILVSHEMGPDKRKRCTDLGLAWCEVKADDVLQATHTESFIIPVFACALSTGRCMPCLTALADKERRRVQQELHQTWTRALGVAEEEAVALKVMKDLQAELETARKFLADNKESLETTRAAVTAAKRELSDVQWTAKDPKGLLTFGKHRGAHIQTVWSHLEDKRYIVFLAGYSGRVDLFEKDRAERHDMRHTIPSHIADRAQAILQGLCKRCFEKHEEQVAYRVWCLPCYRALS